MPIKLLNKKGKSGAHNGRACACRAACMLAFRVTYLWQICVHACRYEAQDTQCVNVAYVVSQCILDLKVWHVLFLCKGGL